MIFESVRRWYSQLSPAEAQSCSLVLHTSCINFSMDSLNKLASLPLKYVLPNNVYWELKHLCQSRIYGQRSQLLLRLANGNILNWDLEMLYAHDPAPCPCESDYSEILLFVFGDKGKQDEFLRHAREMPQHYILYTPSWDVIRHHADAYRIFQAGLAEKMPAPQPSREAALPPLHRLTGIRADKEDAWVNGSEFEAADPYGSNAALYTCPAFPDRYIRIFPRLLSDSEKQRLTMLRHIGSMLHETQIPLEVPREILTTPDRLPLGYTVDRFPGKSLQEIIDGSVQNAPVQIMLHKLALLVLEMHNMHMLAGDLSASRVLADESGNVYLTDCSAFQILGFPGDNAKRHCHPELDGAGQAPALLEPRHECYAFALLVMQCLSGTAFLQKLESGTEYCPCRDVAGEVFLAGADRSIGAWLRSLAVLP